jgi:hypothetical protein
MLHYHEEELIISLDNINHLHVKTQSGPNEAVQDYKFHNH